MNNVRVIAIILLFLITGLLTAVNSDVFRVISDDAQGVEIEFELPAYELVDDNVDGVRVQSIKINNDNFTGEVGLPEVPVFSTMLELPARGTFNAQMTVSKREQVQGINLKRYKEKETDEMLLSTQSGYYPEESFEHSSAALWRDVRVVPVAVYPFRFNSNTGELDIVKRGRIHLTYNTRESGENELTVERPHSSAFTKVYSTNILNYTQRTSRTDDPPCILYVYNNSLNYTTYLKPLVDWKHQQGFEVHTASTSQAGSTTTSIRNYLQNAYQTWSNPPDFFVLVGDTGGTYGLPYYSISYYSAPGDHPYALVSGDDELEDVFMGRISYESEAQLSVIVNKIINYEKDALFPAEQWMNSTLLVGDTNPSGISCISGNEYMQDVMEDYSSDFTFTELYGADPSSVTVSSTLNSGVGYFHYRGWIGMSGFYNSDISSLNNIAKTPICIIITCDTGTYTSTARTEEFLRAGSVAQPKGGVAAIGMSTSGTHTAYNNCLDGGIVSGLFVDDVETIGEALNTGKNYLWTNYGVTQPATASNFMHMCNLMGDPSLRAWKGAPEDMTVSYPSIVSTTTGEILVNVSSSSGDLEGARVTILKGDDEVFATGLTNAMGEIYLPITEGVSGSVTLTVTKPGFTPHIGSFALGNATYSADISNISMRLGLSTVTHLEPGNNAQVYLSLQNNGTANLDLTTCTIEALNDNVTVGSSVSYGTITSGSTVTNSSAFYIQLENACFPEELDFLLHIDSIGDDFVRTFSIPVEASNILVDSWVFQTTGTDVILPGQTSDVTVTLRNIGNDTFAGQNMSISSIEDNLQFPTQFSNVGAIAANGTADVTFQVTADATIIPGAVSPITVAVNSLVFNHVMPFNVTVGQPSAVDPLGPDSYGYYIYDMGDTRYSLAPEYNWVDVSQSANRLNISDTGNNSDEVVVVNMPFPLRMYGESYNQITVCSNGWIGGGVTDQITFRNWRIPGPIGPSPMIAPFWDDLETSGGGVYAYYNSSEHYYVVQWDNCEIYNRGIDETFQVIIYDETYHPTPTNDCPIKFQYQTFNNVDNATDNVHGEYCTIGIENHDEHVGLEYTFNDTYPSSCAELSNNTALYITTEAPEFVYETNVLAQNQTAVNQSGSPFIEAGDVVTFSVDIVNLGMETASNVSVSLSETDAYATLNQTSINIGTLAFNESYTAEFEVTVSSSTPAGHAVLLQLNVTGTPAVSFSENYSISVGIIMEDFETGNLNNMAWEFDGDAEWYVTPLGAYEGTYCIQSGSISHSQTSQIMTTQTVATTGDISFYSKVSSEANYDYLRFYIDGNLQEQWAGSTDWELHTYSVSQGTHTFNWTYYKDGSQSNGSDCAWVDYITFPPLTAPYPDCSVSPALLDFGDVVQGGTQNLQFDISNDGTMALTGTIQTPLGFAVTNTGRGDKYQATRNTINFTVGALGSETFNVAFTPTTTTQYVGDISINHNAAGGVSLVAVSGMGVLPNISIAQTQVDTSILPNDQSDINLTINNTGIGNLTYSLGIQDTGRNSGGPDTFGYEWIDSREAGGPAYNWVEISGVGTALSLGDDAGTSVNLPFSFDFYGTTYNSINVCSNGYLTFSTTLNDYSNDQIPNTRTPNNFIAPLWDDLRPASAGGGGTIYHYNDTANNRFIVQYDNIRHYYSSGGYETFEVILYPNGDIVYQYDSTGSDTDYTIGIESSDGTDGLQICYYTAFGLNDLAIRISNNSIPEWLTTTVTSGTVEPGTPENVLFSIDSTDLDLGVYTKNIVVTSNDPDNGSVVIPVTLTVTNTPALDTPVSVTAVSSGNTIILSWDAVDNAASYKIYASDDPYATDWGQPIITVTSPTYTYTTNSDSCKFFKVVASSSSRSNAIISK